MLTRKNYIAIAKCISDAIASFDSPDLIIAKRIICNLQEMFQQDNHNFNGKKFFDACMNINKHK